MTGYVEFAACRRSVSVARDCLEKFSDVSVVYVCDQRLLGEV